jgi:drug/metabolite transporter (DMT)-like permease
MYYGLVCIAVVLFGSQFLTNSEYVKKMGSGLFQTMFLSLLGGVLGAVIMLFTNKFRFEYTHFTLIMAFITFLNGFLFTLCSLKAFEYVNLAVYSVYSMLGGMILPILAGVIFYGETFTVGLGVCIAFICVAIVLVSVKKSGKADGKETKKNWMSVFFYVGVFLFNGMSGVISKFYTEAPYLKASSAGYSLLSSLTTVVIALTFVLSLWKKHTKIYAAPTLIALCGNAGNRVANYLLLLALTVLPASVNYSFVTGGTIIVSTVLSYFTDKKPTVKEWLAVAAAFIGIMFLVLLPF